MKKKYLGAVIAGICAGSINGLLGAGGGMLLVPLLTMLTGLNDTEIFPASVSIILPICLVSLLFSFDASIIRWTEILPYLLGSAAGGIFAGLLGKKIPVSWLHKLLGALILVGGVRYLC